MTVNSKKKGNRFELEMAKRLSEFFDERVPTSGAFVGGKNRVKHHDIREDAKDILSGDLITPSWFPFSIECKFHNDEPKFHHFLSGSSILFDEWWEQAKSDAEFADKHPMLVMKVNRKGTYIALARSLIENMDVSHIVYRDACIIEFDVFLGIIDSQPPPAEAGVSAA